MHVGTHIRVHISIPMRARARERRACFCSRACLLLACRSPLMEVVVRAHASALLHVAHPRRAQRGAAILLDVPIDEQPARHLQMRRASVRSVVASRCVSVRRRYSYCYCANAMILRCMIICRSYLSCYCMSVVTSRCMTVPSAYATCLVHMAVHGAASREVTESCRQSDGRSCA